MSCCCHHTCCCSCGSDSGAVILPSFPDVPVYPDYQQFPVYVSYPSFYASEPRIDAANEAIFTRSSNGSNGSSGCGCRR